MPEIHVCTLQQLADSFDCHPLKIRCMVFFGLMPAPCIVDEGGTNPRWCLEELAVWIAHGMPTVDPSLLQHQQANLTFLSRDELADLLGCNVSTVFRMEKDGRLPRPALRAHRMTRWSWESIKNWVNADCPAADPAEEVCPDQDPKTN